MTKLFCFAAPALAWRAWTKRKQIQSITIDQERTSPILLFLPLRAPAVHSYCSPQRFIRRSPCLNVFPILSLSPSSRSNSRNVTPLPGSAIVARRSVLRGSSPPARSSERRTRRDREHHLWGQQSAAEVPRLSPRRGWSHADYRRSSRIRHRPLVVGRPAVSRLRRASPPASGQERETRSLGWSSRHQRRPLRSAS